jgi:uncharacterized protein (DUF58 family)
MAVGPYGALLEAVRGVRWPARRPVSGGAPGAHLARTRGVASEFAEYRPYRQGDDPRRLDWKLLARSDRAFVRLAPDHAVLSTLIVVDGTASMAFPAAPSTAISGKWGCARQVAVACAAVAHASADPVGLCIVSANGVTRLAPRARRRRRVCADARCRAAGRHDADCLGDLEGLKRAARAHVAAGGEVHVVHVVSRAELEPTRGAILAVDPEDPTISRPLTDATRAAYRAAFDAWRMEIARGWRDDGVAYHEIIDDEATDVAIRRVVALPGGGARI